MALSTLETDKMSVKRCQNSYQMMPGISSRRELGALKHCKLTCSWVGTFSSMAAALRFLLPPMRLRFSSWARGSGTGAGGGIPRGFVLEGVLWAVAAALLMHFSSSSAIRAQNV